MAKPRTEIFTKRLTTEQWDNYIPAKTLAAYLRQVAARLAKLPADTRGKITLHVEIGRPVPPGKRR